MSLLYIPFLEIAYKNHLQLFYGKEKEDFIKNLEFIEIKINRSKKNNRKLKYDELITKINNIPGLYQEQLLKLLCSSYHSLSDIGFCWIEPCDSSDLEEILDELEDQEIDLNIEEFKSLFSIWVNNVIKDTYALGDTISDEVRENVRSKK